MKTIEKDIYDAFAKAGAILKANASDPGKVYHIRTRLRDRVAFSERREQIKESMPLET